MWQRWVGVLCVVALIAGCGSGGGSRPKTKQQGYIQAVRDTRVEGIDGYTDADLRSAGSTACQILLNPKGQTFSLSPVENLVRDGWDTAPAAVVSVQAQKYLCPAAPKTHLIH